MSGSGRPRRSSVFMGMLRIARGRADGLGCFGDSPQAFLVSLTPMGGLMIVGMLEAVVNGGAMQALAALLPPLCALLAPPALSYEFARLWRREALWLRYATALNWCQLMLPFIAMVLLFVLGVARSAGLPQQAASIVMVVCLGGYGLWLNWFLARHGLQVGRGRAALLVAGVNLGTALLVFGPRLLLAARE